MIFSHLLVLKPNRHLDRDVFDYIKANNISSTPTKVLDSPFRHYQSDSETIWYGPDGVPADPGDRIVIKQTYCYRKTPLPPGFEKSPECLARPYFVWGFSSLGLYIIFSLQLVWTLGMFIVWLDANVYGKLCRNGRKMRGSFRNALDLAEAIKEVLGDDLCAYSNRKIARQLAKFGRGLQFYSTTEDSRKNNTPGISHIGISSFTNGQRLQLEYKSLYGRAPR